MVRAGGDQAGRGRTEAGRGRKRQLAQSPTWSWETWNWEIWLQPTDLLCGLGKLLPLSGPVCSSVKGDN